MRFEIEWSAPISKPGVLSCASRTLRYKAAISNVSVAVAWIVAPGSAMLSECAVPSTAARGLADGVLRTLIRIVELEIHDTHPVSRRADEGPGAEQGERGQQTRNRLLPRMLIDIRETGVQTITRMSCDNKLQKANPSSVIPSRCPTADLRARNLSHFREITVFRRKYCHGEQMQGIAKALLTPFPDFIVADVAEIPSDVRSASTTPLARCTQCAALHSPDSCRLSCTRRKFSAILSPVAGAMSSHANQASAPDHAEHPLRKAARPFVSDRS